MKQISHLKHSRTERMFFSSDSIIMLTVRILLKARIPFSSRNNTLNSRTLLFKVEISFMTYCGGCCGLVVFVIPVVTELVAVVEISIWSLNACVTVVVVFVSV